MTINVWLAIIVCVILGAGLIAYALRTFNNVKAGGNMGKAGFFIEASGKTRDKK